MEATMTSETTKSPNQVAPKTLDQRRPETRGALRVEVTRPWPRLARAPDLVRAAIGQRGRHPALPGGRRLIAVTNGLSVAPG